MIPKRWRSLKGGDPLKGAIQTAIRRRLTMSSFPLCAVRADMPYVDRVQAARE